MPKNKAKDKPKKSKPDKDRKRIWDKYTESNLDFITIYDKDGKVIKP